MWYLLLVGLIPTTVWLVYYYRRDNSHPEPKRAVLLTLLLGALVSIPILVTQVAVSCAVGDVCVFLGGHKSLWENTIVQSLGFVALVTLIHAFIEEYFKYRVVKDVIMKRSYFTKPIDGIMFMIFSALGFATVENILIGVTTIVTASQNHDFSISSYVLVLIGRFIGANLIHVICSGIVGYFLVKALIETQVKFHTFHRHLYVDVGLMIASALHFIYNFFIIIVSQEVTTMPSAILGKYTFVTLFIVIFIGYYILSRLINLFNRQSYSHGGH